MIHATSVPCERTSFSALLERVPNPPLAAGRDEREVKTPTESLDIEKASLIIFDYWLVISPSEVD
jgi:hypothetical protein